MDTYGPGPAQGLGQEPTSPKRLDGITIASLKVDVSMEGVFFFNKERATSFSTVLMFYSCDRLLGALTSTPRAKRRPATVPPPPRILR